MDIERLIYDVNGAALAVHEHLPPGFLESVYKKALLHELELRGIHAVEEQGINIYYKGHCVGNYKADIFVENRLILELKSVSHISVDHELQLVNYLTATGIDTGILYNFGSQMLEIKRKYRLRKDEWGSQDISQTAATMLYGDPSIIRRLPDAPLDCNF